MAAWIAAIAASLAFLVSLGVFLLQLGDRRRRQASLVSAWVSAVDSGVTASVCTVYLRVANHSDEPV